MSLAVSSAPSSPWKVEELFPKEIIEVLGGKEAVEKLRRLVEKPLSSALNLEACRRNSAVTLRNRVEVLRGFDSAGRPFLEVYMTRSFPSLIYFTATESLPGKFTELSYWQVGEAVTMQSRKLESSDLELLSRIAKREDAMDSYQAVLPKFKRYTT